MWPWSKGAAAAVVAAADAPSRPSGRFLVGRWKCFLVATGHPNSMMKPSSETPLLKEMLFEGKNVVWGCGYSGNGYLFGKSFV